MSTSGPVARKARGTAEHLIDEVSLEPRSAGLSQTFHTAVTLRSKAVLEQPSPRRNDWQSPGRRNIVLLLVRAGGLSPPAPRTGLDEARERGKPTRGGRDTQAGRRTFRAARSAPARGLGAGR